MGKLQEIVGGWKNYVFANPDVEEQAKERMEICIKCDFISDRGYCALCGCYMAAKVRSPKSKCRAKKW